MLVVAACGGSSGTTTNPTPATGGALGTVPPSAEAATEAPAAATEAPAGATEPPTGGGTAGGVCDLVTPDELAAIFGVASVTTTVFPGPPDTCSVESDAGDPLVAWSYSTAQASVVFDAFVADPSSVSVSGIGDKAAFVQNTGLLVLKGGAIVVVSVQSGDEEHSKAVGKAAAGRM